MLYSNLCRLYQVLILIFVILLFLLHNNSFAYSDIGIGLSPLSINETAFVLNFSTSINKLKYGFLGIDSGFYITQSKFDHQTKPEYSGGWGWYHYYEYYKSYWIITLGMFYSCKITIIPLSLRVSSGFAFESECIEKKRINTRAGKFYEHPAGTDNNVKVSLYFKPEIRFYLRQVFISFSIWKNTKYLKETFLIGFQYK